MRKPLAQPPKTENAPGLMPVGLDAIVVRFFFLNFVNILDCIKYMLLKVQSY
jgi:hypothetical protein